MILTKPTFSKVTTQLLKKTLRSPPHISIRPLNINLHTMDSTESACKKLIPILHQGMHKGDCGRIGIFGGCEEYTGAPYYVASTALRLGADLSYVYCEKDAGHVIKTYSPELIVLPYLRSVRNSTEGYALENIHRKIISMVGKHHAFSVGSGLGHDSNIQASVALVVDYAREHNIPIVLDADIIRNVAKNPQLIHGHKSAVITPNINEFKTLVLELGLDKSLPPDQIVKNCAKSLGGATVVLKGKTDIISNGDTVLFCSEAGGLKRCGGQGDILAGAIATFLGWGVCYQQGKWDHDSSVPVDKIPLLSAYAACKVARTASRLAYEANDLGTQTTDILNLIGKSLKISFDQDIPTQHHL